MIIFAMETSFDDLCAAIIDTTTKQILANCKITQNHNKYGGVVPELAARQHLAQISEIFYKVLNIANLKINKIDKFAATVGPGLIITLSIGFYFTKTLAILCNKPFDPIHHLEGHLSVCHRFDEPEPHLALIVSGGHTVIYRVDLIRTNENYKFSYKTLGTTLDDAAGELLDKVGRALDLEFPAGPQMEQLALKFVGETNKKNIIIPIKNELSFSFSGLKTRYLNLINSKNESITNFYKEEICYTLIKNIAIILEEKIKLAIQQTNINMVYICGGVAANKIIREQLSKLPVIYPTIELCTDNAVMIAFASYQGRVSSQTEVFAKMPLD